jgi:hypothetical protein
VSAEAAVEYTIEAFVDRDDRRVIDVLGEELPPPRIQRGVDRTRRLRLRRDHDARERVGALVALLVAPGEIDMVRSLVDLDHGRVQVISEELAEVLRIRGHPAAKGDELLSVHEGRENEQQIRRGDLVRRCTCEPARDRVDEVVERTAGDQFAPVLLRRHRVEVGKLGEILGIEPLAVLQHGDAELREIELLPDGQ